MKDHMITIEQAAEIMQLPYHTVYAMVRRGQLPFVRLGHHQGAWRCPLSKLYDHIGLIDADIDIEE